MPYRPVNAPKILPATVVLAGGTGGRTALSALKTHCLDLAGIVGTGDTGGSTGQLRRDNAGNLVRPAYGDLRQGLIGLATNAEAAAAFSERNADGHVAGNLLLLELASKYGLDQALRRAEALLGAAGRIIPASSHPQNTIVMQHRNEQGRIEWVIGEHDIDEYPVTDPNPLIKAIPVAAALHPEIPDLLQQAGLIVVAQGSRDSSIKAVLSIPGMAATLARSPAPILLIANQSLEPNIPAHVAAPHLADYVQSLERYLGGRSFDGVIYNTNVSAVTALRDAEGNPLRPIRNDAQRMAELEGRILIGRDLFGQESQTTTKGDRLAHLRQPLRHNPDALLSSIHTFMRAYARQQAVLTR